MSAPCCCETRTRGKSSSRVHSTTGVVGRNYHDSAARRLGAKADVLTERSRRFILRVCHVQSAEYKVEPNPGFHPSRFRPYLPSSPVYSAITTLNPQTASLNSHLATRKEFPTKSRSQK